MNMVIQTSERAEKEMRKKEKKTLKQLIIIYRESGRRDR